MKKSSLGSLLFTGALLAALIYAGFNAQGIYDWLVLQTYDPPAEIEEYADETRLSDYGRRILYVAKPSLSSPADFNDECPFAEDDRVLGCFDGVRIYILDVEEPKLEDVEPVTAVHEMLHSAYKRLSGRERSRIDELLLQQQRELDDPELDSLIETYREDDETSVITELYARFATEYQELIPELEEHYSQYFDDRSAVVALHAGYQQVFDDIDNKIDRLSKELEKLKTDINNLEDDLESQRAKVDNINEQLNQHLEDDNISAYNTLIPTQNQAVRTYNATLAAFKSKITQHNNKADTYNETLLYKKDLVNSIDSNFQEAQAQ